MPASKIKKARRRDPEGGRASSPTFASRTREGKHPELTVVLKYGRDNAHRGVRRRAARLAPGPSRLRRLRRTSPACFPVSASRSSARRTGVMTDRERVASRRSAASSSARCGDDYRDAQRRAGAVCRASASGRSPIPKGVTVNVTAARSTCRARRASSRGRCRRSIKVKSKEGDALSVASAAEGRDGARLQGLARALIASMREGRGRRLRADSRARRAPATARRSRAARSTSRSGLSHPVVFPLPPGLTALVPRRLQGNGPHPELRRQGVLGQTAATIRVVPAAGALRRQGRPVPRRERPTRRPVRPARSKRSKEDDHGSADSSARERRKLRIRSKISGTPERPRLSVFRSSKHIYAQVVDDVTRQDARGSVDAVARISRARSKTATRRTRRRRSAPSSRRSAWTKKARQGRLRSQRLPLSRSSQAPSPTPPARRASSF